MIVSSKGLSTPLTRSQGYQHEPGRAEWFAGPAEAVQYAYDRGRGRGGGGQQRQRGRIPAAYDDYVIAVGAVRFDKTRASQQLWPASGLDGSGGDLDVDQNGDGYADGVLQQTFKHLELYLSLPGRTSMASPHVAGLAALLLSRQAGASPAVIERLMAQSAQNLGSPDQMGAGLIQAADALSAITGPEAAFTRRPLLSPRFPRYHTAPLPATATPTPTRSGRGRSHPDATPLPVCRLRPGRKLLPSGIVPAAADAMRYPQRPARSLLRQK
jgi:hypothetical protein